MTKYFYIEIKVMKRSFDDKEKQPPSRKIVNVDGQPKSVNQVGSDAQRRAALTASVSPDAIRFTPPQVGKKS